jgi:hypothetical protein
MQFIQLSTLSALLLFFIGTAALPHYTRGDTNQPLTVRNITQFPNTTFVENLAIRSNGQALVTLLSTPEIFLVDPEKGGDPQLVHKFAGVTGLSGISEIEDDVFAVVAGNLSLATFQGTQGMYQVIILHHLLHPNMIYSIRFILGLESRHEIFRIQKR